VNAAIYADASGNPATTPLATTTMTVGALPGFYAATFAAPVSVSGDFYVAVDHSGTTTFLSSLTSGASGQAYFRFSPTGPWLFSSSVQHPAFKVLCSSGGGAVPVLANKGLPVVNQSYDVELGGAAPNAPSFLLTGLSNTQWAGGALPFSLGVLGGGTCSLLVSAEHSFSLTSDSAGRAVATIPVP